MAYILIVDDDVDFASAAATVLRGSGHEVEIETNPVNVVDDMTRRSPDLIVLDVMFPEDSAGGFELARSLRGLEAMRHIPILLLTAVNNRFALGYSARDIDKDWMPVDDFLEKPVDLDIMRSRIEDLLDQVHTGTSAAEV